MSGDKAKVESGRVYTFAVNLKANPKQVDGWREGAKQCNMSLQSWMRMVLDYAVGQKQLNEQLASARQAVMEKHGKSLNRVRWDGHEPKPKRTRERKGKAGRGEHSGANG